MSHLESKQKMFFEELKYIQESAVVAALCNYKSNDETENMLYEITYDVICDLMEVLNYMMPVRITCCTRKKGEFNV